MALKDLMTLSEKRSFKKVGLSQQRLKAVMEPLRQYIAFWREYPDLFIDFLCGGEDAKPNTLHLFFYQRVFLRACMRHRYVYATFPRAFSKSFLAILILALRCVLYPRAHLFVTTGGKQQAAGIAKEKMQELCKLIPGLKNEIDWGRGATKTSKDSVEYIFKNGSVLDIIAARQSSRGRRATGGLIEEVILVDGTLLNEVIIPTMNVDRRLGDGTYVPQEMVNKSQIYVTTAGWKNSFAYDKLIELLVRQVLSPNEAMILGGTFKIPVMQGLLSKNFVTELQLDDTYTADSFSREYQSVWSGDAENAFFSAEVFDRHRVLAQAEHDYSGRSSKAAYYVLGIDVGRKGCTTEVCVFKVTPQSQSSSYKSLVNLFTLDDEHFENQAIAIKKIFFKYKARKVAIDGNGLGIGLIDYMITSQIDPQTGDNLPPFGVDNDEDGYYKKYKTKDTIEDAMYIIKANAPINTQAYSYVQAQLSNGKIKLLIDETSAKVKLLASQVGKNMTPQQRADYLKPYAETDRLRDQMLNLIEENQGINIILKQNSRSINKDKFSAFCYGLYYIRKDDELNRKKRGRDLSHLMLFN